MTNTALSGSQIPFEASSSTLALEARSIGTSKMILAGSARERKTGSTRYAGALRSGRKCRRSNKTRSEMHKRAMMAKMSEPVADAMVNSWLLVAFGQLCATLESRSWPLRLHHRRRTVYSIRARSRRINREGAVVTMILRFERRGFWEMQPAPGISRKGAFVMVLKQRPTAVQKSNLHRTTVSVCSCENSTNST